MKLLLSLALAFGCSCGIVDPALAQAKESPPATEAPPDNDEGLICRRETVTGSHRRVRVCTTQAQRDAARESSREFMRDVVRPPAGSNAEGGR